jgi:hypothetical protein
VIAAHAAGGSEAVCAAVVAALNAHRGQEPVQDDMTLVIAERVP